MSLIHEIPELDRKGLREFGLLFAGFVAGLFGLLIPWLAGAQFPIWPWIIAALAASWSIIAPDTLRPFYRLWMKFGMVIGAIVTRVILGIVFFLVVLPIGIILRTKGTDPMSRVLNNGISSYRIASKRMEKNDLERPF